MNAQVHGEGYPVNQVMPQAKMKPEAPNKLTKCAPRMTKNCDLLTNGGFAALDCLYQNLFLQIPCQAGTGSLCLPFPNHCLPNRHVCGAYAGCAEAEAKANGTLWCTYRT